MNGKRIFALLLALVLVLSLCACGRTRGASESVPAPMAARSATQQAAEYVAYDMDYMEYEESGFGAMNSTATTAKTADAGGDAPTENPEKIIYSGDATVETTTFDESIAALEAMIAENGGFIEASSVNGVNYYNSSRGYTSNRSASYTLRVPSERFNTLMGSLSNLGSVPYSHTYTENVTAEYYDVQARLKALQAQEARLLEMMELAGTVEDIITIEDKLSDVRYRIDSFQSSLNNWDRRVAYSSLSVTVKEVQAYTPEKVTKITYGQELVQTFVDAVKDVGDFFRDLLVFLVSCIPALVILAVLALLFRPLIRKLAQKGKTRRAARKAAKKPAEEKIETIDGE